MTISVVVRAKNEAKYLSRLVKSINSQTQIPKELILVDSGSSDGTVELARQLGFFVHEICASDFTYGRALNIGCEFATGEVIVSLSAHVEIADERYMENLLEELSDSRIGFAYTRQFGDEQSAFSERVLLSGWFPHMVAPVQSNSPFANNASSAFRKEVWARHKFHETLPGLEDVDFCKRIAEQGYLISYLGMIGILHSHDSDKASIRKRYSREATALDAIYGGFRIGFWQRFLLFAANSCVDIFVATRNFSASPSQFSRIIQFRWHQFRGVFDGQGVKNNVPNALLRRFYFPPKNPSV